MHINEGEGKLALFSNVLLTPLSSYTSTINLVSLFSFIFPTSTSHLPYRHGVNVFHFKKGVNSVRPILLTSSMCHVHWLQRILLLIFTYILFCLRIGYFEVARDTGLFLHKSPRSVYQKSNKTPRLYAIRVNIANFSPLHFLSISRRDLNTKKTKPNIKKMTGKPRSNVRILIY